jgi:hypothetical protein
MADIQSSFSRALEDLESSAMRCSEAAREIAYCGRTPDVPDEVWAATHEQAIAALRDASVALEAAERSINRAEAKDLARGAPVARVELCRGEIERVYRLLVHVRSVRALVQAQPITPEESRSRPISRAKPASDLRFKMPNEDFGEKMPLLPPKSWPGVNPDPIINRRRRY